MTAQAEMFGDHGVSLPPGMRYFYDIISQSYEHDLVTYIANLPLKAFEFSGGFKGNRRVMSFGWRYDYDTYQLRKATPISAELADMRRVVASRFNVPIKDLKQALVTEYAPGAGSTETKNVRRNLACRCWPRADLDYGIKMATAGTASRFRQSRGLLTC